MIAWGHYQCPKCYLFTNLFLYCRVQARGLFFKQLCIWNRYRSLDVSCLALGNVFVSMVYKCFLKTKHGCVGSWKYFVASFILPVKTCVYRVAFSSVLVEKCLCVGEGGWGSGRSPLWYTLMPNMPNKHNENTRKLFHAFYFKGMCAASCDYCLSFKFI